MLCLAGCHGFAAPDGRRHVPRGPGCPAEKSNELLVNAKEAVDELWRQRGLDPKKPELTKARLGYALDKEEAVGYVVTGAMHLPRLSPDEARAIGKRIVALVGASGTIGSKLKALKKRGKAAAPQIAALLQTPAMLNLEPPPRKSTAPSLPPPAPPPPPMPPPPSAGTRASSAELYEKVFGSMEAAKAAATADMCLLGLATAMGTRPHHHSCRLHVNYGCR